MLWTLSLFIASAIFVYFLLSLSWKWWIHCLRDIPCPFHVPWLGSTPYLVRDAHAIFKQIRGMTLDNNGLFMLWMAWRPAIFVSRVEQMEHLFRSNQIILKSDEYKFFHDWLGTGLLTSSGEKWRRRRKLITPSFHFSVLQDSTNIFIEHSDILIKRVEDYAKQDEVVNAQNFFSRITLSVICQSAMGVKIDTLEEGSDYVKSINTVMELMLQRMRSPWIWFDTLYRMTKNGKLYYQSLEILHKFTTDVINKKIESRTAINNNQIQKKKAFLDMLLELYDKGEIDIDGIREEVDTFMFRGHDTTAVGLSRILHELGNNLEVQEKLHQEIDSIEKGKEDFLDKVLASKYLECVIKEGLRKHPPVPMIARMLENDEILGGVKMTKGSAVIVDFYGAHRSTEYWDEPNAFQPERFLEENFKKRSPFTYVPFSAGPRNCIGQKFAVLEIKIFLYRLMKNFSVKSLLKEEKVKSTFDLIHASVDGLFVKFEKRQHETDF